MDELPIVTAHAPQIITVNNIAYEAIQAGFPKDQIVTAVAVALAESKGNLYAHNSKPPDDSYGLWQINMYGNLGPARLKQFGLKNKEQLYGSAYNARAAKAIYDGSGWRAWSTYKSGAYRIYIPAATMGAASPVATNIIQADPPGWNPGQEGTTTQVDLLKPLKDFMTWLIEQLSPVMLRVGMFLGGGILIITAIILYVRGQVKS